MVNDNSQSLIGSKPKFVSVVNLNCLPDGKPALVSQWQSRDSAVTSVVGGWC